MSKKTNLCHNSIHLQSIDPGADESVQIGVLRHCDLPSVSSWTEQASENSSPSHNSFIPGEEGQV